VDVESRLFRLPLGLRLTTWLIIGVWVVVALFPLLWILIMSFKLPIDAFNENALEVILGPRTLEAVGGISLFRIALGLAVIYGLYRLFVAREHVLSQFGVRKNALSIFVFYVLFLILAALSIIFVVPWVSSLFATLLGNVPLLRYIFGPVLGLTAQHYRAIWIDNAFYQYFLNTLFVTVGVVTISLTIGTLAGYGLARTRTSLTFWILIVALIFRALPHSTLVTGYLPAFIDWGLYGKRVAVIIVLVAINQPFTIWMLRSFFMNIPAALDEAALVDGCNRLQAFWNVIMPIMWPGVITTGLFSFMLAYNDYLVSALLLDGQSRTMVPAILSFFNRETTLTDQLEAIAAAASITFPLFLLVLFFQRQIVSGLTQGAVKG
jgi:trehalose/maltose transport system permease protein